ncbi:MAG: hypothetical protein E7249_13610 [Paenibacillaceae bacterium]|nr:hypothetical protein [Paenibacillaceae bacterium]
MNIIKLKKFTSLFLVIAILSTSMGLTQTKKAEAATWYKLSTYEYQTKYQVMGGNIIVNLTALAIPQIFAISKAAEIVIGLSAIAFTTPDRGNAYVVLTEYVDCKPEKATGLSTVKFEEKVYADSQHKKLLYSKVYTKRMNEIF